MDNLNEPVQQPQEQPVVPETAATENKKFNFMGFLKDNKGAIWIIIVSLLALGIALFFAFRTPKNNSPSQPKVKLSIDVPNTVSSGSEVVFKVNIKNSDNASLKDIGLDLVYPNGFTFSESVPKPSKLNGTQYGLPTLEPGQDVSVMIKGNIQGNAGETKSLRVVMHYKFGQFSSEYVLQEQAQFQIKTADIVLQFDGPLSTSPDQDQTYTLNYANYTDKEIAGFKVIMTLPSGFKLDSAEPAASFGNTWNLGNLSAGQSGKIALHGAFKNVNPGDQQVFTATAEGSVDGKPSYTLSAGQLTVNLSQIPLQAELSLEGNPESVKPGESLRFNIAYKNNSDSAVRGVVITAKLNGTALDMEHIGISNATVRGDTITWDASQNQELESLGSGQGGTLDFTVNVKDPATRSNVKNLVVGARTEIKSTEFSQAFVGKDVTTKIETTVELSQAVSFVSGANPPKVGQSSTYMVVLSLKNGTNDVVDGKMTFNIPSAQSFNANTVNTDERSNISYDPNTKKLTWNISKLAANAGSYVPLRKLQFNITVNPANNQRGNPLPLVTNIKYSGTDSFTSKAINANADPVSTADDPSGDGVVQ